MSTPNLHQCQYRVYYEDTDAGGVVYHANYLRFFERARTEWLRQFGFSQQSLIEQTQTVFVVVGMQLAYKAPARLDDLLTISTRVSKLGGASIAFEQRCEKDGQLLVQADVQLCCVNTNKYRPTPIPEAIRAHIPSPD